jgi:hypothetical protein
MKWLALDGGPVQLRDSSMMRFRSGGTQTGTIFSYTFKLAWGKY